MKIATLATICFAVGFATAIAPAQTGKVCIAEPHIQNAGWTNLGTDYVPAGPDLAPVQGDRGILKT